MLETTNQYIYIPQHPCMDRTMTKGAPILVAEPLAARDATKKRCSWELQNIRKNPQKHVPTMWVYIWAIYL